MSLVFPPQLPPFSEGTVLRKGRNTRESYERGWTLGGEDLPRAIRQDELWNQAVRLTQDRSVVDERKLMNLYLIIRFYLPKIEPGHIVEFGSYRGGSALFMASLAAELLPGVNVYALDTFEHMPATDKTIDLHTEGDFEVALEDVQNAVRKSGLTNLHLVPGRFEDTAQQATRGVGRIALAHLDCDIYSALVTSWDAAKLYMVRGGYVVFDDSIQSSCMGATEMVEEIMVQRERLLSEQAWPHAVFRYPPLLEPWVA